PGSTGETLYGLDYMHQIYTKAQSNYSGIVTVPVLWDKQQETIVNNESSEIIRMLNSAFNELTGNNDDYYPQDLRAEIDSINQRIYDCLNNGVYRCGFAATQAAYDEAFDHLFDTLDFLETHLSQQRYLVGEQITEADLRLIPTLLRFDPVYVGHFKCNRQRISDFDNLSNYTRDLYQQLDLSKTTYFDHIKRHYYFSHEKINPTRIVPKGPNINLELAHDRNRF
ncbi:MAG: glutathione S-transferase C-terminal domain-containing protein, partial [Gammaproteobacteria bacterium]|nr:glutathione S-transferase C-terminal domain-containing protein [Gammaproteobacteria bacterium]